MRKAQTLGAAAMAILWTLLPSPAAGHVPPPGVVANPTGGNDITPADDVAVDGLDLQWAIDHAGPDSTILIRQGVLRLGLVTSNDFEVTTANGSYGFWQDFGGGGWFPVQHPQTIDVHVPGLVITGEVGAGQAEALPDGSHLPDLLTTIVSDDYVEGIPGVGDVAFTSTLVLNAPGVTIQGLRFEGVSAPLFASSPGFDVRHCRFSDLTDAIVLAPDNRLTYPSYPSPEGRISSSFRDNVIRRGGFGIRVIGSGISVTNNDLTFDRRGIFAIGWGYIPDITNTFNPAGPLMDRDVVNWWHVNENVISGNRIDMLDSHDSAILGHGGSGGENRDNLVADNVIRSSVAPYLREVGFIAYGADNPTATARLGQRDRSGPAGARDRRESRR